MTCRQSQDSKFQHLSGLPNCDTEGAHEGRAFGISKDNSGSVVKHLPNLCKLPRFNCQSRGPSLLSVALINTDQNYHQEEMSLFHLTTPITEARQVRQEPGDRN